MTADGKKYCPKCDRKKPLSQFYQKKNPRRPSDKYFAYCKGCCRVYQRTHAAGAHRAPFVHALAALEEAIAEAQVWLEALRSSAHELVREMQVAKSAQAAKAEANELTSIGRAIRARRQVAS